MVKQRVFFEVKNSSKYHVIIQNRTGWCSDKALDMYSGVSFSNLGRDPGILTKVFSGSSSVPPPKCRNCASISELWKLEAIWLDEY